MISNPTAQTLIGMVNCTNQILRVLPTLGVDVTTWDTIIKYKLTSKLDRVTHKKWLDQVKLRQKVPLEELVEFLEIEASENLPFTSSIQHRIQPQRQQQRRHHPQERAAAVLTTVSNPLVEQKTQGIHPRPCPQCGGSHLMFMCRTFLKLPVKDRIGKIREFKRCMRCLGVHAQPTDCTFGACRTCNKEHNSLLCYTKERAGRENGAKVASLHTTKE